MENISKLFDSLSEETIDRNSIEREKENYRIKEIIENMKRSRLTSKTSIFTRSVVMDQKDIDKQSVIDHVSGKRLLNKHGLNEINRTYYGERLLKDAGIDFDKDSYVSYMVGDKEIIMKVTDYSCEPKLQYDILYSTGKCELSEGLPAEIEVEVREMLGSIVKENRLPNTCDIYGTIRINEGEIGTDANIGLVVRLDIGDDYSLIKVRGLQDTVNMKDTIYKMALQEANSSNNKVRNLIGKTIKESDSRLIFEMRNVLKIHKELISNPKVILGKWAYNNGINYVTKEGSCEVGGEELMDYGCKLVLIPRANIQNPLAGNYNLMVLDNCYRYIDTIVDIF